MNGNGHANGHTTNGNSAAKELGIWSVGLITPTSSRYLTAETFGFKINANGTSLKKKQTFTLEPAPPGHSNHECICLKSHLGRYLAVDTFGNVTCDQEEKNECAVFEIHVKDGTWSLLHPTRSYYLGVQGETLVCKAKSPGESEKWLVHLAARPQVNLKSVGRKRYAQLAEDEIHVDANVPWGSETLFTLEFRDGWYGVGHASGKWVRGVDGKLQDTCDKSCLFTIEYHAGHLSLRDPSGLYLAPIGSKAVLKTRSHTVTKDELFILEDSLPQGAFVAGLNSRFVSTKQGIDVTANQDEISSTETFQLEYDHEKWYIRTMQDKYWGLQGTGGIQAVEDRKNASLFSLQWTPNGSVQFLAPNGKYIGAKRSGHLYANSEGEDENAVFWFYLINRPTLCLRCDQGYVGYKSRGGRLECNKASYEAIRVERNNKGAVQFGGSSPQTYWSVGGSELRDSETPTDFYLELRGPNKICIKTSDGLYLNAGKNGQIVISSESGFWEF